MGTLTSSMSPNKLYFNEQSPIQLLTQHTVSQQWIVFSLAKEHRAEGGERQIQLNKVFDIGCHYVRRYLFKEVCASVRMKKILFGLLLLNSAVCAQEISPQVVNTTGGTAAIGNITLEWNVGESVGATFLFNSNGSITSGQLQPLEVTINVEEKEYAQVILYPVPAMRELNISASDNISHIRIYDTTGRLVLLASPNQKQTLIDVSAISTGIYQVILYNSNGQIIFKKSISKAN